MRKKIAVRKNQGDFQCERWGAKSLSYSADFGISGQIARRGSVFALEWVESTRIDGGSGRCAFSGTDRSLSSHSRADGGVFLSQNFTHHCSTAEMLFVFSIEVRYPRRKLQRQ